MGTFRILSLDGGGLLGAFSVSALARLEELSGNGKIVDHFDLITGTSTGGIIAIGLAMGIPIADLQSFYRERGAQIFPRAGRARAWVRTLVTLFRPKFRSEQLRDAIEAVVGNDTLAKAKTRVVIPAYKASPGRVHLFKTAHSNRSSPVDYRATDVALATSAAPTYFPAHEIDNGVGLFVDGGIWANCPAVIGIVEAISFCDVKLEDIDMLSIGTTSYPFRIGAKTGRGGYFGWAPKVIETFMFGQVQGAVSAAKCLLADRFLRIDAETPPKLYSMDDPLAIEELMVLGRDEADKIANRQAVQSRFLNGHPVTPFDRV